MKKHRCRCDGAFLLWRCDVCCITAPIFICACLWFPSSLGGGGCLRRLETKDKTIAGVAHGLAHAI